MSGRINSLASSTLFRSSTASPLSSLSSRSPRTSRWSQARLSPWTSSLRLRRPSTPRHMQRQRPRVSVPPLLLQARPKHRPSHHLFKRTFFLPFLLHSLINSACSLLDTGITFSPSAPAPIASKEAPHTGTGSLLDDFLAPSPAAASKSTASASSGSSALQQLAGLNLTPAALAAAPVAAAVNPLRLGVLSRLEPAIFQSYWKGFTAM